MARHTVQGRVEGGQDTASQEATVYGPKRAQRCLRSVKTRAKLPTKTAAKNPRDQRGITALTSLSFER